MEEKIITLKADFEGSMQDVFRTAGLDTVYEGERVLEGQGTRALTVTLTAEEQKALENTNRVVVTPNRALKIGI